MFSFFGKATSSKITVKTMKGFKVSLNKDRSKKYGIAAESLENLRSKVKVKFKLETFSLFFDGSLLEDEDYFSSLPTQPLIIVAEPGDEVKTDLQLIIESFRRVNHDILRSRDLIHEYVKNDKNSDVLKAISQMQNEVEAKITLTTREADPEWFEGLDEKLKTKEDVMRRKGQDRVKGYFYKTKDELTKSSIYRTNVEGRKIIDDLLTDFFLFLNGVDYFSCIFDRTFSEKFVHAVNDETDASNAKPKRRRIDSETKIKISESNLFKKFQLALCNDYGSFHCHGPWNVKSCTYEHVINPYSSRESVVLFQIYNLDHQIEISRSIFPSILKSVEAVIDGARCASHSKKSVGISVFTYFREIFTIDNLKLVHIVCHDKGTHDELKSKGKVVCENCIEYKNIRKLKMKL